MGVGGSKGGIGYKIEKHRKKQLSKRKPMFGKIIGNAHLEGENTAIAIQRRPRRDSPSDVSLTRDQEIEEKIETGTSSRSLRSSQYSLTEEMNTSDLPSGPSRCHRSAEHLPNLNSSQDTLSRELALTSSPHFKDCDITTVIRKPRSNTSNSILEPEVVAFGSSHVTNSNGSLVGSGGVDTLSPTRKLFLNSKTASKPRHSMYFLHSFPDSEPPQGQTDPSALNGLSILKNCSQESRIREPDNKFELTANTLTTQCNTRPGYACALRLQDKEDTTSSLSGSDTTEDSFFGEDTKFYKLHNYGDVPSPNKDSNIDSERYSLNHVLDSQECDISSSVEDIICGEGDFSDSGCHIDELAAKYLTTQSFKKVRLNLNQVKYVGLSLVGGADSPFGSLPVLVKEVMPGGAGELCGISRGDEIIGINNVSLEDKPLQFAVERLRQCSSRDQEIILWVNPQDEST